MLQKVGAFRPMSVVDLTKADEEAEYLAAPAPKRRKIAEPPTAAAENRNPNPFRKYKLTKTSSEDCIGWISANITGDLGFDDLAAVPAQSASSQRTRQSTKSAKYESTARVAAAVPPKVSPQTPIQLGPVRFVIRLLKDS